MAERIKKDVRDIYVQTISAVIGAVALTLLSSIWKPVRDYLGQQVTFSLVWLLGLSFFFLLVLLALHLIRVRRIQETAEQEIQGIENRHGDEIRVLNDQHLEEVRVLKIEASTDSLTRLPDPEASQKRLEDEYANALLNGSDRVLDLSIILIDIDDFKSFNDLHGYSAGDAILTSVGTLLRENVFLKDFVGKYREGDEFIVVLAGMDVVKARELVAEKLRGRIIEPHKFEIPSREGTTTVQITVSAGVVQLDKEKNKGKDEDEYEKLKAFTDRAEVALGNAKDSGKNAVRRGDF